MQIYIIVLIEIIVFPSLHHNKNASLMIRNDAFTGTVSASMPLSTQIRFLFVIIMIIEFPTLILLILKLETLNLILLI